MTTRQLLILSLLTAVAGILHTVEGWVALPIPVPGIKLGIANVVSLVVIAAFGTGPALMVAMLRVFLGSLLGGMLFGPVFAMGLVGAAASVLAMSLVYRRAYPFLSLIGVSVVGALIHNIAQISVAAMLVGSADLFWYLPYLAVMAIVTGVTTGIAASYFMRKTAQILS